MPVLPMPPPADEPADARPVPRHGRAARRMAWALAISLALHLAAALPMAHWTAEKRQAPPPGEAQPAVMEVLLSDPTRGAAPEDEQPSDSTQADTATAQAEADAQPPAPDTPDTPPSDTAEATPAPAEPQPEVAEEALPLPPPPPLAPPLAPPPAPPAAPQRAAAQPAQPIRLRPGASPDGKDEGRTEIVVGDNVVPASADPGRVNIPPRYPLDAARRGQQGEVVLSLLIATDGSVLSVEVARSSGYPALDRAAREAAAKWHFRPGMRDGIPIPTTVPYTMVFQLGG